MKRSFCLEARGSREEYPGSFGGFLVALAVFLLVGVPLANAQDLDFDDLDDLELLTESESRSSTNPSSSNASSSNPVGGEPTAAEADDLEDLLGDLDLDQGGEDSGEGRSGSSLSVSVLSGFRGFLEFKPRVYLRDRGGPENDEQLLLLGELELDLTLGSNLTGYVRPRFLVDLQDGQLDRFEPYEAFLTFSGSGWDLRAGQFVENWGIVDTFNPVDVVSRRDLGGDILDPARLGEAGIRARWFGAGGETWSEPTLSAYWIPVWRPTLFAPEDQRFYFGNETVQFDEDRGFEPDGGDRHFFGLRFQHILNTEPFNADVQYVIAHGPEWSPAIVLSPQGVLVPAYFGVNTFGVGFRAVANEDVAGAFLSTLTFKVEAIYKDPYLFDDSPLTTPDDYASIVMGVDRAFYDILRDQDQLTLTVEYAREDGADDVSARLRPFLNDIILRALWEANDFSRTSFEVRGFYDFENEEKVLEAILETQLRSLDEDLKLTLQLQLFDPPETGESLYDFFPNNSSVSLGLRWDF